MKNILKFICLLIVFVNLSYNNSFSQLSNKWEIVDSTNSEYGAYRSGKNELSGFNENNIVVIGGYQHSMDYYENLYSIRLYENKATTSKVIYQDSIPTSHRLLSVAHPSDSLIIVVGDSNYFQEQNLYKFWGLLMISTDNGITWQRNILDSNKSLISISMFDDMNGIIYQKSRNNYLNQDILSSDSLLITENGWKNYWSIPISKDAGLINDCYYLSKNKYFLRGGSYIYFSLDGGQNWKKTSDFEGWATDMEIIDDNVFYVATNFKPFSYNSLREPILFKTTDAGETWLECREFFNNSEKYSDVNSIYFYDEMNGIATFESEILLKTTDGGNSWSKENLPYIFEAGTFNWAHSAYYPNKDFCFATGALNYTFVFKGEKILSKPQFHEIINRGYLPVNDINIEWGSVYGAMFYKVKIDTLTVFGKVTKDEFNNPWKETIVTGNNIFLENLEHQTTYFFWVKAYNQSIESDWSMYGIATIDSMGYYTPEIIEPYFGERVTNSKITIKWNNVIPVEKYKLEIENSVNDDFISETVTDTVYILENVVPSAYYLITLASYYENYLWNDVTSYFKTESVLSIDELEKVDSKLKIFPNPVNESCKMIIYSSASTTAFINVYNLLGTKISYREVQLKYGENNIQLNTEMLSSGIYGIEVISSEDIKRGFFIKQ